MSLSEKITEIQHRIGLSTDERPTDMAPGSTIYEYDLKRRMMTPDGEHWVLDDPPCLPAAVTSIDLKQVAGSYDLFELSDNDIQVMELTIIIPRSLIGEVSFTGITIQSTDATPVEFISAAEGAKANLVENAHMQYCGNAKVSGARKIQVTIKGGAVAEECSCVVYIQYVGVT